MNDFDYTQYGTTEMSEEQRTRVVALAADAVQYAPLPGAAQDVDALCTALRELDRLRAENAELKRMQVTCIVCDTPVDPSYTGDIYKCEDHR